MKKSIVAIKMQCQQIFEQIQQQKRLSKKMSQLQYQYDKYMQERKQLQQKYHDMAIDIKLYRKFFKYFVIHGKTNDQCYQVNKIFQDMDSSNKKKFWSVEYSYYIGNICNHKGSLSLRKFLQILRNNFQVREKVKKNNK